MKNKKESNSITAKELMMAGIFTAVYLVIYIVVSIVFGLLPFLANFMLLADSIILGIPMMLYFAKIKKFGLILFTYTVAGLVMVILGLGAYSLVAGVICALIAELLVKSGDYKSSKKMILGYALCCVGSNANVAIWKFGGEKYIADTRASMGDEYVDEVLSYFNIWWVLPALLLSGFIGGLIGGYLGKKVLRKHFERSGLV